MLDPLFDLLSWISAFADGPKEASRFGSGIGLKFNLEIGGFGEEFFGRFCKEDEANVAHGGDKLAFLGCDFDKVIRTRFVAPGIAVEQGVGEGKFFFAMFAKFTDPNVAEA